MTQTALTREQVLAMEPGEELDGLISKHVFGVEMVAHVNYSTDISAAWEVLDTFKVHQVTKKEGGFPPF